MSRLLSSESSDPSSSAPLDVPFALMELKAITELRTDARTSHSSPPSVSCVVKLDGTSFGGTSGASALSRSGAIGINRAFVLKLGESEKEIAAKALSIVVTLVVQKVSVAIGQFQLSFNPSLPPISVPLKFSWQVSTAT